MAAAKARDAVQAVIALAVGLASERLLGFALLIPSAFTMIVYFAGRWLLPPQKQAVLGAIAWQAGQLGWLVLAVIIMPAGLAQVGADIVLLSAGIVWFYLTLSRASALTLVLYHAAGLAWHLKTFLPMPFASSDAKALLVHMVWRAMAIVILGVFIARKSRRAEAAAAFD